jgi:ApaG protein
MYWRPLKRLVFPEKTGNDGRMENDLLDNVMTFEAVTRNICVAGQSYYLLEQSRPELDQHVWAYRIRITNEGKETVTLLNRHWIITDGNGKMTEVKGSGVVGEQPRLKPQDRYIYTSGTPLATPTGFMTGSYEMQTEDGALFDVDIPTFSLDSPHTEQKIN